MNELVDFGFLAAKVAAIGNEKAKMAVDGVSFGVYRYAVKPIQAYDI